MYRLITESLLGLRLEVDRLHFEPCLPAGWGGFKMHYRYRETVYHISIVQGPGAAGLTMDGESREGAAIRLVDDGRDHVVEVRLGAIG
jgi:cellobiose phosphorylase